MDDNSGSVEPTVSDQLRSFIVSSGLTAYTLGKSAGVDAGMVQRFLNGERGLRLATVDRLASALGLRLVRDEADLDRGKPRETGEGPDSIKLARNEWPDETTSHPNRRLRGG